MPIVHHQPRLPNCPWDLTGDCEVDGADLGQLLAAWGSCPGFEHTGCPDSENSPDEETMLSAQQGDYGPLFLWLISQDKTSLAYELLHVTGSKQ